MMREESCMKVMDSGWRHGEELVGALHTARMRAFDVPVPLLQHGRGVVEREILPYVAEELARLAYVEGYFTGHGRLKKLRLMPGKTLVGLRRVLLRYQAKRLESCPGSRTVFVVRNRGVHYYHNGNAHTWPGVRWVE
jgi:hypothetical protein